MLAADIPVSVISIKLVYAVYYIFHCSWLLHYIILQLNFNFKNTSRGSFQIIGKTESFITNWEAHLNY